LTSAIGMADETHRRDVSLIELCIWTILRQLNLWWHTGLWILYQN